MSKGDAYEFTNGTQKQTGQSHLQKYAKNPAYMAQSQNKLACPVCETGFLFNFPQTGPSHLQITRKNLFTNGPRKWVTPGTMTAKFLAACQTFQDIAALRSPQPWSHYRKHTDKDEDSEHPFQQEHTAYDEQQPSLETQSVAENFAA